MTQQDSLSLQPVVSLDEVEQPPVVAPLTPRKVLGMLPADATPAQQDSAIQAVFQPKTISYSSRPDTLHLPGHNVGRSIFDTHLPVYYRESFFSVDTLFHPELSGGRYGMAGDPLPYTLRSDNVITLTFILCFIFAMLAFKMSSGFIFRQLKDFFYEQRESGPTYASETANEVRFQFFLILGGVMMLSIYQFLFVQNYIGHIFMVGQYQMMALSFALLMTYLVVKYLLYAFVDSVFFTQHQHYAWVRSQLFILALGGAMVTPVVMLQVYFDLSIQNANVFLIFLLIIVKILLFYKCFAIFFKRLGAILQIILYFCALEIVPLVFLWGGLLFFSHYLKVNY